MPGQHATIGASSMKRIIECPGSLTLLAALEAGKPSARRSSIYAAEGTAAHAVAEKILGGAAPGDLLGKDIEADGYTFTIDEEMLTHVDQYVAAVQSLEALGADISLEQQVSPFDLLPKDLQTKLRARKWSVFGTADCAGIDMRTKTITVLDFKYGRGVTVEADGNAQARYYGLGVLQVLIEGGIILPSEFAEWAVRIGIVQPRAYHEAGTVRWDTGIKTAKDLIDWCGEVLVPAIERVVAGDTTTKLGPWCQFCALGAVPGACPSMTDIMKTAEASRLLDMSTKRADEIGEYLKTLDVLENHIAAVRDFAHNRLEQDPRSVSGFKLVAKRATRRWTDEADVANRLTGHVDPAFWQEISVKSPAQVLPKIKKMSATLASELENQFVVAKSSGKTLAPDDDPRPAVAGRPPAKDLFPDDLTD